MTTEWPRTALSALLRQVSRPEDVDPSREYTMLGTRWYAGGLFRKEVQTGQTIKAARVYRVECGDFIYNRLFAWKGSFAVANDEAQGCYVSNEFPCFEVDASRLDARYLMHYFTQVASWNKALGLSSGATPTSRNRLKEKQFLGMSIPLPPMDEQCRLVRWIEAIAERIEEARRLRGEAEADAAVLFRKRLAEQMEEGGRLWTRSTVADVITSMASGWSPQCGDVPAESNGWGVLKTTAVQWCEFRSDENKALPPSLAPRPDLAAKCGDVLVTRAGPMKRVGVPAAVMTDHPRLMISDKIIRLRPRLDIISPRFLELALAAPLAQDHLLHRKTGLADAQVNISQGILRSTPLIYPPLTMQAEIVSALEALQARVSALCEHQSDASGLIEALLPACLDKAFRGEM